VNEPPEESKPILGLPPGPERRAEPGDGPEQEVWDPPIPSSPNGWEDDAIYSPELGLTRPAPLEPLEDPDLGQWNGRRNGQSRNRIPRGDALLPRTQVEAPGPASNSQGPDPMAGADPAIALWGSPQSGKTTYLASLRHATSLRNADYGDWNIFPTNPFSAKMMADFTHELNQGNFPNPTLPGEEIPLSWMFVGDVTDSRFVRRRRRLLHRGRVENRFTLDLVDVSGKAFAHDPGQLQVPSRVANLALDRLTGARGIIYLFDPIGERDNRNSYSFVNRAITELKHRATAGRQAPLYLNQKVSICVTKFDDPAVFQEARRNGFVNYGPDGMPHVLDRHAEDFFELLCTDNFWRTRYEQSARSADFIRRELRQVFSPGNIKYFVTSSIGFYVKPGSRFDPDDFSNVAQATGNMPRIRGSINPINVLEPLISVQQRITERG
jgi:GTPase SAR1 family protein